MKSVKKNIIFNLMMVLCKIIFPIISFPYAARVLGVENIGKVNYCISVINYFVLFAGLGVNVYATREGVRYRDDKDELSKFAKEVFSINFVSTIVAYILLFGLIISNVFYKHTELMLVCSLNIVFSTFGIEWVYQIVEDYKYISLRTIVIQFISFICLITCVKKREDYIIYAIITVFAAGGNCFANIWQSRKIINWKKRFSLDIKKHFKPILIIFGVSASTSIYLSLDMVMVGVIRDDYEVGLYSAAVKLNSVVKTLITSISSVLLSRLSYYKALNKNEDYIGLLKRGVNTILILVIPASFGIIYLSREIMIIFCGKEFDSAVFACIILSVNMVFSVVDGMIYNQICLPNKLEKQASKATFVGAAGNFVMNLFFVYKWGYEGAAITTLLSEVMVFCILLKVANKVVDMKEVFKSVHQYILSGGLMMLILFFLGNIVHCGTVMRVIMGMIVGGVSYFGALIVVMHNDYVNELIIQVKDRIKSVMRMS